MGNPAIPPWNIHLTNQPRLFLMFLPLGLQPNKTIVTDQLDTLVDTLPAELLLEVILPDTLPLDTPQEDTLEDILQELHIKEQLLNRFLLNLELNIFLFRKNMSSMIV